MEEREYIVRLRMPKNAAMDPAAGIRKLQKILKRLGRSYGIKAVSCEPAKQPPTKE